MQFSRTPIGKMRRDRIRYETIQQELDVKPVMDLMAEDQISETLRKVKDNNQTYIERLVQVYGEILQEMKVVCVDRNQQRIWTEAPYNPAIGGRRE